MQQRAEGAKVQIGLSYGRDRHAPPGLSPAAIVRALPDPHLARTGMLRPAPLLSSRGTIPTRAAESGATSNWWPVESAPVPQTAGTSASTSRSDGQCSTAWTVEVEVPAISDRESKERRARGRNCEPFTARGLILSCHYGKTFADHRRSTSAIEAAILFDRPFCASGPGLNRPATDPLANSFRRPRLGYGRPAAATGSDRPGPPLPAQTTRLPHPRMPDSAQTVSRPASHCQIEAESSEASTTLGRAQPQGARRADRNRRCRQVQSVGCPPAARCKPPVAGQTTPPATALRTELAESDIVGSTDRSSPRAYWSGPTLCTLTVHKPIIFRHRLPNRFAHLSSPHPQCPSWNLTSKRLAWRERVDGTSPRLWYRRKRLLASAYGESSTRSPPT